MEKNGNILAFCWQQENDSFASEQAFCLFFEVTYKKLATKRNMKHEQQKSNGLLDNCAFTRAYDQIPCVQSCHTPGYNWVAPTREDLSLIIQWPPHRSRHPARSLGLLPSREWIHIPPGEKGNHLQICHFFGGYVSSLEGILTIYSLLRHHTN